MIDPAGLPPRPLPDIADPAAGALGRPRYTRGTGAAAVDWFGAFPAGEHPAIVGGPSGAVSSGVEESAARVLARLGNGG